VKTATKEESDVQKFERLALSEYDKRASGNPYSLTELNDLAVRLNALEVDGFALVRWYVLNEPEVFSNV
jgi:hypothetical protein